MSTVAPFALMRGLSRRLRAFLWGLAMGLVSPAMKMSTPMANRGARGRTRRRLAAGTDAPPPSFAALDAPRRSIAGPRASDFSTLRVDPGFGPRAYAATFAAIQRAPSQLLDLVAAHVLSIDVFERLAAAWTAPADTVPRLGIVLSFERWVMLHEAALAALRPVAERGVRVEVFYDEQTPHLAAWFAHGQVVHNPRAVIATLARRWHPSERWPEVIMELTRLVRANAGGDELPALLVDIADLALSCGGADHASTLAREAIYYLRPSPSATRGQALRVQGTALMTQGQIVAGLRLMDEAIAVAARAAAPSVGASALCQSGLCVLNHGDYAGAERRFRRAIELLTSTHRQQLRALAHHSLAVALMHQGKDEAEHHARAALALRTDPTSHVAEEDRLLLQRLCEVNPQIN